MAGGQQQRAGVVEPRVDIENDRFHPAILTYGAIHRALVGNSSLALVLFAWLSYGRSL
ncbi:hypothetical protein GCM10028799_71590 [Kribbella italica]